jgi:hypothetical protein
VKFAGVGYTPVENRPVGDVVLLAQRFEGHRAGFGFARDRNDLFVGESLLRWLLLPV